MTDIAAPNAAHDDVHDELSQMLLKTPYQTLSPVQKSVVDLVCSEGPSPQNPVLAADTRTYWERLADQVAAVGGSWNFIFGFGALLAVWIVWNVAGTVFKLSFDPYPFIFLNLILSMLAAIQAPVIMMSQNRAAARDGIAAEHDYIVNLRAELEIMHLHDKLDAVRERELVELIKGQSETLDLLRRQLDALTAKVVAG